MTTYYTYYSYEEFGRGYIGYRKCPEHLTPETDPYLGSYRDKKFKPTHKIILGTYDNRTDAIADEIVLHKAYDVACNLHFANKARQTSVGFAGGTTHTPETRAKISEANRKRKYSAETKAKISEATRGKSRKPHSAETRAKMSEAKRGRTPSAETKAKISKKLRGKPKPVSARRRISRKYTWENTKTGVTCVGLSIKELISLYPELHYSHLRRTATGKYKHHKGWRVTLCHLVEPSLNRFKVMM